MRGHHCELISRNGHVFKSWPYLNREIAHAVRAHSAVLDGEICCLEPDGRSHFRKLFFRREWPYFYAFDLLSVNGQDVRALALLERKRRLLRIMPRIDSRLLSLDHIAQRGRDLYRVACDRDLEGIVAKWAEGTSQTDWLATSWLKIKNPDYSQIVDRHELFEADECRHVPKAKLPQLDLRLVQTWVSMTTALGVVAAVVLLFVLWKVLRRIFPRELLNDEQQD